MVESNGSKWVLINLSRGGRGMERRLFVGALGEWMGY